MFDPAQKVYRYFQLGEYVRDRIKDYDGDALLIDWTTMDQGKFDEVRIVKNLSDVFGKVGGM